MSDNAIDALRAQFEDEVQAAIQAGSVQGVRDRYLGRKDGAITRLLKTVATLPPDERRVRGALANAFKQQVETRLAEAAELVGLAAARSTAERNRVDVTLPGRLSPLGHRHPLTLVRD